MPSVHGNSTFEGHVDLRGTRLFCRLVGQGPILLLLHGWALDGAMWRTLQDRLARQFRVLVVDRRGYGRSTGSPSIEREVKDLRVLCQRLGLRNIAVLGMSQAARVALRLSLSRSLRVSSLVLDGPPGPTRGETDPATEDPPLSLYRKIVAERGMGAFRKAWGRHALLSLHSAGPRTRRDLDGIGRRYRGRDLMHGARKEPRTKTLSLSRIRTPSLILYGGEDLMPRQRAATELAGRLPRSQLVRLPGSGHLPNLDVPLAYEQALTRFLRRHALRSRKS